MKKQYSKPNLDSKAFAQFESVFTACDKGNAMQGCQPDTYETASSGLSESAAYKSDASI